MTTYKVIGMFLWVSALVLLMQLCGAPFNIFVNIPAAIFVLLGIFGAVMLTKSPQQTRSERFKIIAQAAWHSGFISFAVGLIAMLSSLNDPKTIGPNLAVALTGVVYGLIVSLVFNTLSLKAETPDEK